MTDDMILAGFDPSKVARTNNASSWTDAVGNFAISPNAAAGQTGFPTNGVKTVEIYATDDAGSVGNVVTLTLTVQNPNLALAGQAHGEARGKHRAESGAELYERGGSLISRVPPRRGRSSSCSIRTQSCPPGPPI